MVATYSATEGTIGAFEIPKIVVLCLHREIHKNTRKSTKRSLLDLKYYQFRLITPSGPTLYCYCMSTIDLSDLDPTIEIHFGRLMHTEVTRPKRWFSQATCWPVDGIGRSPSNTTYRLKLARNPAHYRTQMR